MKYVYWTADELGIDQSKICTMGISGGAWIVLGAAYIQARDVMEGLSDTTQIKAQFLISPDVSCSFG